MRIQQKLRRLTTFCIILGLLMTALFFVSGCGDHAGPEETESAEPDGTETVKMTESESETDTGPDLISLLKASTQVAVSRNATGYVRERAEEFAGIVNAKLGTELDVIASSAKSPGRIFFGMSDPAETDKPTGPRDFVISSNNDSIYISLGTDYAAQGVVDTMKELVNESNVKLPYEKKIANDPTVILKVGSYNIHNGQDVGHDFTVIAKDILDAGLDIVGIQEVDFNTDRNKKQDTIKIIAEATGYEYYYYTKCIDLQGGGYGTAILSRYPITSSESVELPSTGEQRCYGHVTIDVGGREINLFNTHLAWPQKNDRLEQIPVLARAADKCDNVIVTGDMNSDGHEEYGSYFEGFNFANGDKGDENYFVTNAEDGAIDNVISSVEFTQLDSGIIESTHSDHSMIWALLRLD